MNNTKSQFLDNIRKYLTIVSQIDYKLGEPMQKVNIIVFSMQGSMVHLA